MTAKPLPPTSFYRMPNLQASWLQWDCFLRRACQSPKDGSDVSWTPLLSDTQQKQSPLVELTKPKRVSAEGKGEHYPDTTQGTRRTGGQQVSTGLRSHSKLEHKGTNLSVSLVPKQTDSCLHTYAHTHSKNHLTFCTRKSKK